MFLANNSYTQLIHEIQYSTSQSTGHISKNTRGKFVNVIEWIARQETYQ